MEKYIMRSILESPFKVYGTSYDHTRGKFIRMDPEVAKTVNPGVAGMGISATGGRIAFKTNSGHIKLSVVYPDRHLFGNMTIMCSCGFDLYMRKVGQEKFSHFYSFVPGDRAALTYEGECDLLDNSEKEIIINMPIRTPVSEVCVGVEDGSNLEQWSGYKNEGRIVFYGSSITHGCCASRPGMIYPLIISRALDCDILSLGFSGSAKGEETMARYIAGLDMKLFVCDYDHNAPTPEYLEETHERFYRIFRTGQPDTPVLFVTKPDGDKQPELTKQRREIIRKTYENACKNGDRNVYYLDGRSLFGEVDRDCCTVDGCHPNDLGFYKIATTMAPRIREILGW